MRRHAWVLFVSRRYLGSARRSRRRAASALSILGIAAGVTTLITVLSVMNGFQIGTIEDILEVESYHLRLSLPESGDLSEFRGLPGVKAVVPFTDTEGLVRGSFSSFDAAFLRALPRDVRRLDQGFADAVELVAGRFSLDGPRSVVIGSELARSLGVGVGERIRFVALSGGALESMEPEESTLEVRGVFRTGHLDYDRRWVFISQEGLDDLLPAGSLSTVGIKLVDRFQDRQGAAALREEIRDAGIQAGNIESWREYNRAIFGALRVEKLFMTGLVGLVFVVVAFNIYQSQRRSIVERYEDIAILKAMGAGPWMLRSVFALEGFMLGFAGSVSGLILGLFLSFNVNEVFANFAIFSPAYFYISEIPTVLPFREAFGVVLFALASATAAAFFASKRVGTLRPATVLRYE